MATTPQAHPASGMKQTDTIPITNPKRLSAIYSNSFGMSATMTDFTIFFLEVGQMPGDEGTVQKQEVTAVITLPLLAAGGLIEALQQVLSQAEVTMRQVQAKVKASAGGKK